MPNRKAGDSVAVEREPAAAEPSYQVPGRTSGIPDEESMSNSQPEVDEPTAVVPAPTIDPLRPVGPHDQADAWFEKQDLAERRRRHEVRVASYLSGGSERRNRLLGR